MSNHSGSYMLNSVLHALDGYEVFNFLGKENTLEFLEFIRQLSLNYDCSYGEILQEIGEKLGVCYGCWQYGDLVEGACETCRKWWKDMKS